MTTDWPVDRVRKTFVEYFEKKKEHTFVPSSSVVPHEDPTLLFANAGMNQFKPIFLGTIDPKNPMAKLKRAANSQKCIRAGGKHNDLEDVGKDTYHHTFFEMLGNWSFGDYFKTESIEWAWELLTEVYGLPKDRLYATYFGGFQDLPPDDEAKNIWLKYLPAERVLPFGMKENFWEMGDTGPCGPCTEIHFDRIGGRDVAHLVNRDDPTVIEIWNLVFIQFNREPDRSLKPLPAKHVDTGMGLERVTSLLQKKMSNYDTDVFVPIFEEIQKVTGAPSYTAKVGADDTDNVDMAYRVVADHIRTLSFAIADGAIPGPDGRNYVLRRILRRGVRYGRQILKGKPGFFSKLVDVVVKNFGHFFPELEKNKEKVISTIQTEESQFDKTLDHGIEHFTKAVQNSTTKTISGEDAFKLYDTYGFPFDLTQLMAEERGLNVDKARYEELMKERQEYSRQQQQKTTQSRIILEAEQTAHLQKTNVPVTDDTFKYKLDDVSGSIMALWDGKQFLNTISVSEEQFGIIVDKSNFYAESGGQIYDIGVISTKDTQFQVKNVQAYAGYLLHTGKFESGKGSLKVGDTVTLHIDISRRLPIMSNHTSTHILNFALREVLGEHVDQKGSLVDDERLRFDFSHTKGLTIEELQKVEKIANQIIESKLPVFKQSVDLTTAKKINGVRAVFGEYYPDPVTVVSIGKSVQDLLADPNNAEWRKYSVEFCGGTHISNSEEAKHFVILSENGIASGIRRIFAVTHDGARKALEAGKLFKTRIEEAKSKKGDALSKEITALSNDLGLLPIPAVQKHQLQAEINALYDTVISEKKDITKAALQRAEQIIEQAKTNNVSVVIEFIDCGADRKALNNALQLIKEKAPEVAALLFSKDDKKVYMIANVPKSLSNKLSAAEWCKEAANACNGKGGGKPEAAQAQGEDVSKFDDAMKAAFTYASQQLK